MAGGLRVSDPACDLAVVAAILSSNFDLPVPGNCCFAAEVGLSGEIRPVSQIERRIMEAGKIGFGTIFISGFSKLAKENRSDLLKGAIEVKEIRNIASLIKMLK